MTDYNKLQRQFFQWYYVEGEELSVVQQLFDNLFKDLYRQEGQCFKADLRKWKTLHRSWRKKWGIGRRVKGCPPPTPCGLHDYKLWRVGRGRDFPPSVSQNETYSNWSCNDATIKVPNVGKSIPGMARCPQDLNAAGNPDVWWSKDENSTGWLRYNIDNLSVDSNTNFPHGYIRRLNDESIPEDRVLHVSENFQLPSAVEHTTQQIFLPQPYPDTFPAGAFNNWCPIHAETPPPCAQFPTGLSPEILYEPEFNNLDEATVTSPDNEWRFQDPLYMGFGAPPSIKLFGS